MRICLISREYPPDTGWGGIGAYTYQMAHALTDLGHDVEVVSLKAEAKSSDRRSSGSPPVNNANDQRIKVHRSSWEDDLSDLKMLKASTPFSHYVLKSSLALWQTFLSRHEKEPFDVAEVPEHLADGIVAVATKSVPTVIKLHTPLSKFHKENLHGVVASFDQQLICMLERVSMLMADEMCSPSQDLAQYICEDLGVPIESIPIVRNPVNTVQFSPEGEKAELPSKGPIILFVGRLEERKGIQYLIEAVPQVVGDFPKAHFVVVGADTPHAPGGSALAHCKKILREHGCSESVTFIPQVELARMPTYYRAADICVVPSLYDNAPYTCIEAMSCGRAVIGTTSGGTREYIESERSGILVEARNSQALAGAILRLLKNEDERKRYGAAARSYVLANLSNQAVATQMVKLYESAMAKHAASKKLKLYAKDERALLPDAHELLKAFDQLFYDRFYQHSYRFRIKHWLSVALKQPALFRNKLTLRLAKPLARRFPKSSLAQLVSKLENTIRVQQQDRAHQL
jgi:glycogen(starch) synthase